MPACFAYAPASGSDDPFDPARLSFSPDGAWLAIGTHSMVRVLDAADASTRHVLADLKPRAGDDEPLVSMLGWTPDGTLVLRIEDAIVGWSAANQSERLRATFPRVVDASLSPDGRHAAVIHERAALIRLSDGERIVLQAW